MRKPQLISSLDVQRQHNLVVPSSVHTIKSLKRKDGTHIKGKLGYVNADLSEVDRSELKKSPDSRSKQSISRSPNKKKLQ